MLLFSWKVAPALAMGNTVVAKPSEETPSSAALLAEVAHEIGLPAGVFNVLHGFGPNSTGQHMTTHPDIDAVTFTGESRTGSAIMKTVADSGTISLQGKYLNHLGVSQRARAGLGCSYQITSVLPQLTVLENMILAVQGCRGHAYHFWQPATANTALTEPADALIDKLGLSHGRDKYAMELSYGQLRQLEIAMALAMEPKVLLLDEPMAGMGVGESANMVHLLQNLKGQYAILLIEHDMDAVFSLADRISVLCLGKVIYCGDVDAVKSNPQVREAYLGDEEIVA